MGALEICQLCEEPPCCGPPAVDVWCKSPVLVGDDSAQGQFGRGAPRPRLVRRPQDQSNGRKGAHVEQQRPRTSTNQPARGGPSLRPWRCSGGTPPGEEPRPLAIPAGCTSPLGPPRAALCGAGRGNCQRAIGGGPAPRATAPPQSRRIGGARASAARHVFSPLTRGPAWEEPVPTPASTATTRSRRRHSHQRGRAPAVCASTAWGVDDASPPLPSRRRRRGPAASPPRPAGSPSRPRRGVRRAAPPRQRRPRPCKARGRRSPPRCGRCS